MLQCKTNMSDRCLVLTADTVQLLYMTECLNNGSCLCYMAQGGCCLDLKGRTQSDPVRSCMVILTTPLDLCKTIQLCAGQKH